MPAALRPLPCFAPAVRIDPRWATGTAALIGAVMGPVTGIAVLLCLAALTAALERRHAAMLALYGGSLAFAPDALLIAPFIVALLFNRRCRWRAWPFAPLATACMVTALARLVALPFPGLTGGSPNLWAITALLPVGPPLTGLAIAGAVGAAAMLAAGFSARALDDRAALHAAAFTALVLAALLPGAEAACLALPGALVAVRAATGRDPHGGTVTALVAAAWALAATGHPAPGGVAAIAAALLLAAPLLRFAANDNQIALNMADSGTNWVMRSLR